MGKQKEVKKEVVQKEQRGEFNQRDIERELNKYKKGVFYQQPNTTNQNSKYSQFQLTRTEKKAPPKIYREDINGNKTDDDHKEKEKITTKKREKKREKKEDEATTTTATYGDRAGFEWFENAEDGGSGLLL